MAGAAHPLVIDLTLDDDEEHEFAEVGFLPIEHYLQYLEDERLIEFYRQYFPEEFFRQ